MDLAEMVTFWIIIALGAGLATSWPFPTSRRQATNCSSEFFATTIPSGLQIERVQHVTTGFFVETGNIGYPSFPTGLPELCAVIFKNTTADYRFGIFLPDDWNSRFLTIGSYSFLGGINWLEMGVGVKYGAVALSTDTGHSSGAGDITWANTTQKQVNWAWQALQGSIYSGKSLVEAYYNDRRISYSYFSGCSTGGRQGLKQIQLGPDVFDGALIGAPAWDTKHLMPWISKLATWNLPESAPYSLNDAALFSRLQAEVLRQCDALDGLQDNIISAPGTCREKFDISQVRCDVSTNQTSCWTGAQTETALKIYADYVTRDGALVYKGAEYGSELDWSTFLLPATIGNSSSSSSQNVRRDFDAQYERYFMDYGTDWQTTWYNDSVVRDAEARDEHVVRATADRFDLGAFRARGGKVLLYAGLADNVVPVRHTTFYYERSVAAMGGRLSSSNNNGGNDGGDGGESESIDDFFRYFQIPGMRHCWGTADNVRAPWMIGSAGQSVQRPPYASAWSVPLGLNDSDHDAFLALVDWVEKGREVDRIVATEFNFTDDTMQDIVVFRQRPICSFPKVARWDGKGDQDRVESWSCG